MSANIRDWDTTEVLIYKVELILSIFFDILQVLIR